jgi:Sec-independent protein translocase protein TatA
LIEHLLPELLKDSLGSANKIKKLIDNANSKQEQNPANEQNQALQQQVAQLEMMYKSSQTNLNNAKAKALENKNKIDLQKAFANTQIAMANVEAKKEISNNNLARSL